MEANKILQSDLLDIIFEGRNKSYGAYELRSTYNSRIKVAVITMAGICLIFITGVLLANSGGKNAKAEMPVIDVVISKLADEPKKAEIRKPEEPKPVKAKTLSYTPPKIVENVDKTEVPTEDKIDQNNVATVTKDGADIIDIVAPPVAASTGQAELPGKYEEPEFLSIVQIEAKFPGGLGAWQKYLERNLNINVPVDNGAAAGNYAVVVSFVVDKDGNISDVQALNDPGFGTAQEAIRVIKKSKQWTPALQNGRNVTYRQKQSITFVVSEG